MTVIDSGGDRRRADVNATARGAVLAISFGALPLAMLGQLVACTTYCRPAGPVAGLASWTTPCERFKLTVCLSALWTLLLIAVWRLKNRRLFGRVARGGTLGSGGRRCPSAGFFSAFAAGVADEELYPCSGGSVASGDASSRSSSLDSVYSQCSVATGDRDPHNGAWPLHAAPFNTLVAMRTERLLRARLAGHAAAGRGLPPPPRMSFYTSPTNHVTVVAKMETVCSPEELAATMPAVVQTVVTTLADAAADASADARPPTRPIVASFLGFRGCYHVLADVRGVTATPTDAQLAAALSPLLPPGATLLAATVAPLDTQQACWLDSVALPAAGAGDDGEGRVTLRLSPALLEQLTQSGRGLRVVVGTDASCAPWSDCTLRPALADWAAKGLAVTVPTGMGPRVTLALLSTPPPPPPPGPAAAAAAAPHGVDTFVASLPLLVLPRRAAAEAQRLWTAMQRGRQGEQSGGGGGGGDDASAQCSWLAFARDLGAALAPAPLARPGAHSGVDPAVWEALASFVADQGMEATLQALMSGPGAKASAPGPAAAATSTGPTTAAPGVALTAARLASRVMHHSFPPAGEEGTLREWSPRRLLSADPVPSADAGLVRCTPRVQLWTWIGGGRATGSPLQAAMQLTVCMPLPLPAAEPAASRPRQLRSHNALMLCATLLMTSLVCGVLAERMLAHAAPHPSR